MPPTVEFAGNDRFKVVRLVGEGGMGLVYEAVDGVRGGRVALKTLKHADPDTLLRLKREFRALSHLAHPNLVQLYDLVVDDDHAFLTMELIDGEDVVSYCRPDEPPVDPRVSDTLPMAADEDKGNRGVLGCDLRRLRRTAIDLVRAVGALHDAGIIHRDVKPSNALVDRNGRLVLLDFGLITKVNTNRHPSGEGVVGTVAYMAPEQASGATLTPAADWWSVGAVLFEALTGQMPHGGTLMEVLHAKTGDPPSPRDVDPLVPGELDELCHALLAVDPAARPDRAAILRALRADDGSVGGNAIAERGPALPFIGRRRELAALVDATTPHGVVVVRGASGIGKSALIAEHIDRRRAATSELVVLASRCIESEAVPYKAMDAVIDDLARYWRALPDAEAGELVPPGAIALRRLFPVLGSVRVLARLPRRSSIDEPIDRRHEAFGALREVVHRIAVTRPVMLVLDDLQWADRDSHDLLLALIGDPDPPPVVCVLAGRDVESMTALEADVTSVNPATRVVPLGPLDPGDALALAEQAAPGDRARAHNLVRASAGIPFLLCELARDSSDGDVAGVIARRVAAQPPGTRELIELLAVAGEPLPARVVATATARAPEDIGRIIHAARSAHLVHAGGDGEGLECYHDRIRETIRDQLERDQRRRWHRAIAEAFESHATGSAASLARHWMGADEPQRAADHAMRAGDDAFDSFDFARAAKFYDLATLLDEDVGRDVRVLGRLGEAHDLSGRPGVAADAFLKAAELDRKQALSFRNRAAESLIRGGHLGRGMVVLRAVLGELGLPLPDKPTRIIATAWRRLLLRMRGLRFDIRPADQIPPRLLLEIDVCLGVGVSLAMIEPMRAMQLQARGTLLALRAGEPTRLVRALSLEASYQTMVWEAHDRARRCLALAEQLHRDHEVASMPVYSRWVRGARALMIDNRFADAVEAFTDAEARLRERGRSQAWDAMTVTFYRMNAEYHLGDLSSLYRKVREFVREAERRGNRYGEVLFKSRLNMVALYINEVAIAERWLDEAEAAWTEGPADSLQRLWLICARAELALYRGETESAEAIIVTAPPGFGASGRMKILRDDLEGVRARILLARAASLIATDPAAATLRLDAARRAIAAVDSTGIPIARALVHTLRAGLACLISHDPLPHLDDALRSYTALSTPIHIETTRRALAVLTHDPSTLASADAALLSRGVADPARLTACLLPGVES